MDVTFYLGSFKNAVILAGLIPSLTVHACIMTPLYWSTSCLTKAVMTRVRVLPRQAILWTSTYTDLSIHQKYLIHVV